MRNLEAIKSELARARDELKQVEGTPAEVYSRIVGYYRSVRNWNKGKREEWGERKLYDVSTVETGARIERINTDAAGQVLLFVRQSCPACPGAKDAVTKLGIPFQFIDADEAEGLARAEEHQVMSTPTAIFVDAEGREIFRARDAKTIRDFAQKHIGSGEAATEEETDLAVEAV